MEKIKLSISFYIEANERHGRTMGIDGLANVYKLDPGANFREAITSLVAGYNKKYSHRIPARAVPIKVGNGNGDIIRNGGVLLTKSPGRNMTVEEVAHAIWGENRRNWAINTLRVHFDFE